MMASYGYFDDQSREYVITDPHTPVKWVNYIGTLAFGGYIDQTGGMLICRGDPALNRITKYLTQGPPSEFRATTLYLRLPREDGGYDLLSPLYVPTLAPLDRYECHVGLGYTTFITEIKNIRTEVSVFVPLGEAVVIQQVTVTNLAEEAQTLDLIPVVEYTHPDALKQLTNADWVPQTMGSYLDVTEDGRKVLSQAPFMFKDTRRNYFTANLPIASFDTDRQAFLGENGYGTWACPLSLQNEGLGNTLAVRGDNIGALMLQLGRIMPGESQTAILLLGQAESVQAAMPTINRFCDLDQVEGALGEMRAYWDGILSVAQVHTPDPDMNRMLNIHNPRQCTITMNWSRYLSLYQLGFGARGIGFRDSSQDVMGAIMGSPGASKDLLLKLIHVQKRDGSAMHQFNPMTMVATTGEAGAEEDSPDYYSDDHLWGVLAVSEYLKETGDFAFLKEEIPFYEQDPRGDPLETGSVWEHLKRGLAFTKEDTGQHGLPLLGFADWNDTVNLPKGAESLFTAHLYGWALKTMIALCQYLGKNKLAKRYKADYKEMRKRVNRVAWDGDWYVRYFDQRGDPVGSHHNTEGQIFTNAQSWAVLSGFAPTDRAHQAMDAVYQHLNTSKGIKLSTPGYDGYDPEKGGVTTYPPGAKENGGIFLHANPWAMIAETMLGRGWRAVQYYRQINPATKNDIIDEFECEPYVYPQNILGDEHPQFGLGRNAWLTGTAAWAYQAGLKYILGVRPEYDGLRVDPCISPDWGGFTLQRRFRGAVYQITVSNPGRVCQGIKAIRVDGEPIEGHLIPAYQDGGTHFVDVIMG
jgi:cellobiose phosphorylase